MLRPVRVSNNHQEPRRPVVFVSPFASSVPEIAKIDLDLFSDKYHSRVNVYAAVGLFVVAAFVRVHGIPSTSSKTDDPSKDRKSVV